jgi:hypothetical protein
MPKKSPNPNPAKDNARIKMTREQLEEIKHCAEALIAEINRRLDTNDHHKYVVPWEQAKNLMLALEGA